MFYELTQMRSLDDAVARLQRHDDEQGHVAVVPSIRLSDGGPPERDK